MAVGTVSTSILTDIANAIRFQRGDGELFKPREMAAAVAALDGWRHCHSGGVPVDAWEVDPACYSSATARPYDEIKLQVRKVYIHPSWTQVGMTNAGYLFNSFQNMTEVSGFENLSGITGAAQMFTSCASLETIYATSFSVGLGFTPWDGVTGPTHRQHLAHATFAAHMAGYSYLNFQYLFYSCTNLAGVSGLGNLSGVRSMRFMFASCAVQVLDFRGFDPSTLTDLYYAFSSCNSLTTMYADAGWALPTSGLTGSQCFYSCRALVGGNGTAWSSSNVGYTYMRIDKAGTPGYLTSA